MIEIKKGDVACTLNPSIFGRMIKAVTGWLSIDGRAEYGHSLIITSAQGHTLEALWITEPKHLNRYAGKDIVIARAVATLNDDPITEQMITDALERIKDKYVGDAYPWWRLPLYFIQPLARLWGSGEHLVCSELVAKYLNLVHARGETFLGITPDNLADEWRYWRNFEIIYKGVWHEQ